MAIKRKYGEIQCNAYEIAEKINERQKRDNCVITIVHIEKSFPLQVDNGCRRVIYYYDVEE